MSTQTQPSRPALTREQIIAALRALSDELGKQVVMGEICLFGGTAMVLAFTVRLIGLLPFPPVFYLRSDFGLCRLRLEAAHLLLGGGLHPDCTAVQSFCAGSTRARQVDAR